MIKTKFMTEKKYYRNLQNNVKKIKQVLTCTCIYSVFSSISPSNVFICIILFDS